MKPQERIGGWQCWVDIYDDYVIKTFKTKSEIKESVQRYLDWIGKQEEPEERTNKMLEDVKNSTKIIKKSKSPIDLLADLEFLKNGSVKQKKVIVLSEAMENKKKSEQIKLIDELVKFILQLWSYGIHEKTFKFFSNLGVDNNKIVLIDVFELTDDKSKVLKQIDKKPWIKKDKFSKNLSPELIKYLVDKLNKNLTEKNLDKFWETKK